MNKVKRSLVALVLPLALGCALFSNATAPRTAQEVFETAEVAYVSALTSAVDYARACSAEPVVTEECDEFTVKVREVNDKAAVVLALGGLVVAGIPQCDEVANPGCTTELLLSLADQLNRLMVELTGGHV